MDAFFTVLPKWMAFIDSSFTVYGIPIKEDLLASYEITFSITDNIEEIEDTLTILIDNRKPI